MVVVTKDVKEMGRAQAAHTKMAEELERVNSDLATALKGLQEVGFSHKSHTCCCAVALPKQEAIGFVRTHEPTIACPARALLTFACLYSCTCKEP